MEETTLKHITMVSRLPKFGSHAKPVPGSLTNDSARNVSSGWAKGIPVAKQSMVSAAAPFPVKGRRVRGECGEKVSDCREEAKVVVRSQQEPHPAVRQIKKPSVAPVGKHQRSIPTVPSTIPRTDIRLKTKPRYTVPKWPPPLQPQCSRVNVASSSPTGSLQSSLSHSRDNIKSISVENVVRSQSFSYLKRPEATTNPPLTRSFSFTRATELAKELPRPLAQSPVARSPVTQASMVLDHVTKPTVLTIPSIQQSMLKSLLPSCTDSKPSLSSYKLMRSLVSKQPHIVFPVEVPGKIKLPEKDGDSREEATAVTEPSRNTRSAGTSLEVPYVNNNSLSQSVEISDDMSLSSTSSLERNDVSEECINDFDDLGNRGGILPMPVNKRQNDQMGFFREGNPNAVYCQENSSVTTPNSFVTETVDWTEIGLTVSEKLMDASHGGGVGVLCGDLQHGSSLELSPSNSSGGTYMWDEEVLEPIGRTTQLCESFDSNLNSADVLLNVDSCDLEDDGLMLDVDLHEDVSLHSDVDVAPRYDQVERHYWSWSNTQQCRGGMEQLHYGERDRALQLFDNGHTLGLSKRESGQMSLDDEILKHMTQDCTSVKEQLFHLRTLLQVAEEGSADEAEQLMSSPSSEELSYHVDELLTELQKLRDELREKDAAIHKLTQQLSAPVAVTACVCQQGELQRRVWQDNSSQTPQILQPSQLSAIEHKQLDRACRQARSGTRSEALDTQPGDGPVKLQSRSVVFQVCATCDSALPFCVPKSAPAVSAAAASLSSRTLNADHLILLLNTRLQIQESLSARAPGSNCVRDEKAPVHLKSQGSQQVGLGQVEHGMACAHRGVSAPSKTRLRPPASRGLSCISAASQSTRCWTTRTITASRDGQSSSVQYSLQMCTIAVTLAF